MILYDFLNRTSTYIKVSILFLFFFLLFFARNIENSYAQQISQVNNINLIDITIDDSLDFIFNAGETEKQTQLNIKNNKPQIADIYINQIELKNKNGYHITPNKNYQTQDANSQEYSMIIGNYNWDLTNPYLMQIPLTNLNYIFKKGIITTSTNVNPCDIVYTLEAKAKNYTVKFNGNDSTNGKMNDEVMTFNKVSTLPKNGYSRTGYKFSGWSTNQYGTGTNFNDEQIVKNLTTVNNGTVVLYAQWTKTNQKIIVNPNNGEDKYTLSGSYYKTFKVDIPKRTGYIFNGWTQSQKSGDIGIENKTVDFNNPNIISEGKIKPYVYYTKIPDNSTSEYGQLTMVESSQDNPTNNKYEIKITSNKEFIDDKGIGTYFGFHMDNSETHDKEKYYYHTFKAKLPKGTKLKYCYNTLGDNGGITWLTSNYGTGEWEDYTYKAYAGKNSNGSVIGYVIVESIDKQKVLTPFDWYLAESKIIKSEKSPNTNILMVGSEDYEVTAKWTPITWTVKYDANGGTGSMTDSNHIFNGGIKLNKNTFSRDGYNFSGWHLSRVNNGRTEWLYANAEGIYINANQWYEIGKQPNGYVLYKMRDQHVFQEANRINDAIIIAHAQWTLQKYKINYNLDGGVLPSNAPTTYTIDDKVILPTPTKDLYLFNGWKMNIKPESWEDGFISLETGEDGIGSTGAGYTNAKRTGFIKLNKGVTYKLSINDAYGRIRIYDINKKYIWNLAGTAERELTITPEKDIYARILVLDSSVTNVEDVNLSIEGYVSSIPKGTTGDITLTAEWEKNEVPYNITYNLNGGTFPSDVPKTYYSSQGLDTLPIPIKDSEFLGWTYTDLTKIETTLNDGGPNNEYEVEFLEDVNFQYYIDGKPLPKDISIYNSKGECVFYDSAPEGSKSGVFNIPAGKYKISTFEVKTWNISIDPKKYITSIPKGTIGDITLNAAWGIHNGGEN